MKAFVAVALLVACVAAQTTFDREALLKLKNFRVNRWDLNTYNVPEVRTNSYYPYDTTTSNYWYTLEELVRHPLFQQYYTLPLFRQHFTHPLFQHYLTTPEFQKYWTVPEFQTFFRSPVLFYKYIYPVVFSTSTSTDDIWSNYRSNVWNKDVITPTTVWDVLGMRNNWYNKQYYPTTVNQYTSSRYPVDWNREQYYNVMDKIVKPVDVTEVDVKVVKPIVEKIVDPITGEVKYVYGDNHIVGDKVVRDTVEKYINTPRRETIKPFYYNNPINSIYKDDILRRRINYNTPVDTLYNNRDLLKEELLKKFILNTPVDTIMNRDLVKEELLKKFLVESPIEKFVHDKYYYNTPVDTMTMDKDALKKFYYNLPVDTMVKDDLFKKFLINKMPIDTLVKDDLFQKYLIHNIDVPTMTKEELLKKYINPFTVTKDDLMTKDFFPTVVLGDRPTFPKTFDEKMTEQKIVKDELVKKMAHENIIA